MICPKAEPLWEVGWCGSCSWIVGVGPGLHGSKSFLSFYPNVGGL